MASGRRKPLPDGDYLAWTSEWNGFRLQLEFAEPRELRRGGSLLDQWPRRARARVRSDWKMKPPLVDDFPIDATAEVCSRRVADFLGGLQLSNVELLPLALLDQKGAPLAPDYVVVHPTARIDCIDLEASGAKLSTLRKTAVTSVKKLVLEAKRIPSSARLFRLHEFSRVLIVERGLAQQLRALALDGVRFESLNKPWS